MDFFGFGCGIVRVAQGRQRKESQVNIQRGLEPSSGKAPLRKRNRMVNGIRVRPRKRAK